jgi:hypothetical protein
LTARKTIYIQEKGLDKLWEGVEKIYVRFATSPRKYLAQLAQEMYVCIMATKWNKTAEFASV